MATGPQQKRKELREKRLKAEAEAKSAQKRQDMGKIIGAIAGVVVLAVVVVVVLNATGGSDSSSPDRSSTAIDKLLAGIPQSGTTLGDPKAEVTLVEFADLQCPACKQYADEVLPDIISGPVKDGTAKFELRQWAILGPDSVKAASAAYAAAEQDRYWQFLENFYADQGPENSGYVTDDFLKGIAEKAGVPDLSKWEKDSADEARWQNELTETDNTASELGFTGTPSFATQVGDGALQPLTDVGSADAIIKALKNAK